MDDFSDLAQFTVNAMRRSYDVFSSEEIPSAIIPQFNTLAMDMICCAYPDTTSAYFFLRMLWLSDMDLLNQRKITPRWNNPKFIEALDKFRTVIDANPEHTTAVIEAGAEFLGTWARR